MKQKNKNLSKHSNETEKNKCFTFRVFKYSFFNLGFYFYIIWIWLPFSPLIFLLDKKSDPVGFKLLFTYSITLTLILFILYSLLGVKKVTITNEELIIEKGLGRVRTFPNSDIESIGCVHLPRVTNSLHIIYLKNKKRYLFSDVGLKDKEATAMWSKLNLYSLVNGHFNAELENNNEQYKKRQNGKVRFSNTEQCKRKDYLDSLQ